MHNATGRWANYHVLLWHAIGRSFGFTKSSTNTLGIDSENIQKSKVYRFIMAASKMSKYLSRENELGRMSVTGDAKLWRHISEQHPDIMVFLFNEPDQVAGHWNAFFQVFYSWYWGIREDKPDRSKILKPVMTYLSTFKRNNKLHLDAERQEDEVSYRVPGKKLPLRRQSPEVTSLDQLIMHKHKGVISNWLAMFSTNSEDQVLFKTVVASMANQDYTSFTEMVSRLLHFQAVSCSDVLAFVKKILRTLFFEIQNAGQLEGTPKIQAGNTLETCI